MNILFSSTHKAFRSSFRQSSRLQTNEHPPHPYPFAPPAADAADIRSHCPWHSDGFGEIHINQWCVCVRLVYIFSVVVVPTASGEARTATTKGWQRNGDDDNAGIVSHSSIYHVALFALGSRISKSFCTLCHIVNKNVQSARVYSCACARMRVCVKCTRL